MKSLAHIGVLGTFLLAVPATLVLSVLLLLQINTAPNLINPSPKVLSASAISSGALDSLPEIKINHSYTSADSRPTLVRNYLKRYSSVLEPYSEEIVSVSDQYDLDYRLLVAIAQQESNLCKRIPPNSFNCWGFGIYGDKVTRFDNYSQAFEIISATLKKNYIDKGLDTPEKIMAKYTPPSLELGGPWARGVSQFLSEME
ncbi:MAG: hypothetical protein AAB909_02640 [Patescibacteria group bacterium]